MSILSIYRNRFIEELTGATVLPLNLIEADIKEITSKARNINLDDAEEMKNGIEAIISVLEELADKLF